MCSVSSDDGKFYGALNDFFMRFLETARIQQSCTCAFYLRAMVQGYFELYRLSYFKIVIIFNGPFITASFLIKFLLPRLSHRYFINIWVLISGIVSVKLH